MIGAFRRFVGWARGRCPDNSTIAAFVPVDRARALRRGCSLSDSTDRAKWVVIRSGTLIDATAIDAAAAEPPRQKGGGRSNADPDARWMKRPDGSARFGYKLHVAVDQGTGIVRRAAVTPANVADVDKGHELVIGDERSVWADKGYVGPRMRELTEKYRDLPMDLADAALVRVAEREDLTRIFTLDRRHFSVYRPGRRRRFSILPD